MKLSAPRWRSPDSRRKFFVMLTFFMVIMTVLCWLGWQSMRIANPTVVKIGFGIAAVYVIIQLGRMKWASLSPRPNRRVRKPALRIVK